MGERRESSSCDSSGGGGVGFIEVKGWRRILGGQTRTNQVVREVSSTTWAES